MMNWIYRFKLWFIDRWYQDGYDRALMDEHAVIFGRYDPEIMRYREKRIDFLIDKIRKERGY